jgi:hypothetical protein
MRNALAAINSRMVGNSETIQEEGLGNESGVVSEFVDFFQPTIQPTKTPSYMTSA